MNRQPKSKLDLVLSNLSKRITDVQDKQKQQHDQCATFRSFNPGDKVLTRNYNDSEMWLPGKIVKLLVQFHTKFVLTEMVEGTKIS